MTIDELRSKVKSTNNAWLETLSTYSKIVHFDNEPACVVIYDKTGVITHVFKEVEIESSIK